MCALVLGFFMFVAAVRRGFSLVLESRGRLGGKVGSACEEFENIVRDKRLLDSSVVLEDVK